MYEVNQRISNEVYQDLMREAMDKEKTKEERAAALDQAMKVGSMIVKIDETEDSVSMKEKELEVREKNDKKQRVLNWTSVGLGAGFGVLGFIANHNGSVFDPMFKFFSNEGMKALSFVKKR